MRQAEGIDELFRRKNDELVGAVSNRYADSELAQDAVQEAWLRLLDRPDVVGGGTAHGWLYRVACNATLGAKRSVWREEPVPVVEDGHTETDGPLDILLGGLESERAIECLDALSDADRQLLIDLLLRELDADDVAINRGVAGPSVKTLRWRAVQRLRQQAELRGYRDPRTGRALGLMAPAAGWRARIGALVRGDLIAPLSTVIALTLAPLTVGPAASVEERPMTYPRTVRSAEADVGDDERSVAHMRPDVTTEVEVERVRVGDEREESDLDLVVGPAYVSRGDRVDDPSFRLATPVGGVESDDVPEPPQPIGTPCLADSGWCP